MASTKFSSSRDPSEFKPWRRALLSAALVCGTLGAMQAQAQTVLYNTLPSVATGGWCLGETWFAAVEVATPAGAPYRIDNAVVRMHHINDVSASFTLAVHADHAGLPGAPVATIGTQAGRGAGTADLYTFTPAVPIALAAGTNYWIVASSTSANTCAFGWATPGSAPSGVFTYVGEGMQGNGGPWNDLSRQYFALQLNGAPVAVAAVPALSGWSLLALLPLVGGAAWRGARRRRLS